MIEIEIGGLDNPINHDVLNQELNNLELSQFKGTASLIRKTVNGITIAVPRYVLVKTTSDTQTQKDQVIRIVLAHVKANRG